MYTVSDEGITTGSRCGSGSVVCVTFGVAVGVAVVCGGIVTGGCVVICGIGVVALDVDSGCDCSCVGMIVASGVPSSVTAAGSDVSMDSIISSVTRGFGTSATNDLF